MVKNRLIYDTYELINLCNVLSYNDDDTCCCNIRNK